MSTQPDPLISRLCDAESESMKLITEAELRSEVARMVMCAEPEVLVWVWQEVGNGMVRHASKYLVTILVRALRSPSLYRVRTIGIDSIRYRLSVKFECKGTKLDRHKLLRIYNSLAAADSINTSFAVEFCHKSPRFSLVDHPIVRL